MKALSNIKVGDTVIRYLGGIPMPLKVTSITEERIVCGAWEFSRRNGAELDEDLGWTEQQTGSYIVAE
jgi:hypothetical protein